MELRTLIFGAVLVVIVFASKFDEELRILLVERYLAPLPNCFAAYLIS